MTNRIQEKTGAASKLDEIAAYLFRPGASIIPA
jgi:hypothetical protein